MTDSMRQVDVGTVALEAYDLEADDVLGGTPKTAELTVTALGGVEVGIWEITPGTVKDVEKDEAFVVLTGEGTITFASGEVVELSPGSLVRLHAGEETVWEVRSTIRKVYVV
ncbi:cupin domain-containing protein [Nocardioides bigeumensis]|uniref:Cupin domain-containing protein n=1 Tax=Nocardioides bigeumensis TaxID=433657 RepID=A0ABN2YZM5_9ACTN